ncbi:PREDICTED: probable poly(ADP-ribose) glycohydrolase 2 [Camelina sativa]|uniref:poly(ADP-ribose) glycohydrolase n=1 Tax=Camelina sativa TaxID=90675 RepID=A0ABM0SP41_CAMSA|nr:PREDICTED: probable poly(ADP-ribose) glycohydrolase 2 [Camelina sativa]
MGFLFFSATIVNGLSHIVATSNVHSFNHLQTFVSYFSNLFQAVRMEKRADLRSILQYLPLVAQSSSLVWPPSVEEELQTISRGPSDSKVNSGEALTLHIRNMRKSLSLNANDLTPYALQGYALFFDKKISREESANFFGAVVPALCGLLLQLPSMLEKHYQKADHVLDGIASGLRLLGPQEAGIVLLSQDLIAALLACSFFCLFPEFDRRLKNLQGINFDALFSFPYMRQCTKQENKIKCLIHYFRRICRCMPTGFVSFERKILPLEYHPHFVSYPEADSWANSVTPLCSIEVHTSGAVEDQPGEALEVDFADEYFGGLTLSYDTLQEEIRFVINPELIAGMIFLPRMDANEAIEIVGVERFSCYTGYGPSFQYAGDYTDKKDLDTFKRRKTRVIAIDAMPGPGMGQYKLDALVREVNKAFTGYFHQCKYKIDGSLKIPLKTDTNNTQLEASSSRQVPRTSDSANQVVESSKRWCIDHEEKKIGVATGNWGCGVFGGDPELKVMLQWLAISQSGRPFMSYYTFGLQALQNLNQVTERITLEEMTVGDLWKKLVEYSSERLSRKTWLGFFSWLITSLST